LSGDGPLELKSRPRHKERRNRDGSFMVDTIEKGGAPGPAPP